MKADTSPYTDWLSLGKNKPTASSSPFYSRIYAGYSAAQIQCLVQHLEEAGGRLPIFDPMSGQAFALSTLSWFGHTVRINDINPAPLLLAWLRSAPVLRNLPARIAEYVLWLKQNKKSLDDFHIESKGQLQFITGWLSDAMTSQLEEYGQLACRDASCLDLRRISEWDEKLLFRLSILVLAARRLTCYIQSDNRTWLKPGGLDNKRALSDLLLEELAILQECKLVDEFQLKLGLFDTDFAGLQISCADVARTDLSTFDKPCIAVTSPPYANRLDYSVMWAPELWVLSTALPNIDRTTIKRNQIGTTQIRTDDSPLPLDCLPLSTRKELREIEKSGNYASGRYYYPFFRQFAMDLFYGLHHSVKAAPMAEKWIIFIRDTARKDTMFSSHKICEFVMKSCGYRRRKVDDLQIIRSHVGLMRRSKSQSSVHGFAQREWWLAFDRQY